MLDRCVRQNGSLWRFLSLVSVAAALLTGTTQAQDGSLLKNGSFEEWSDGVPDEWVIDVGALSGGSQPASFVRQAEGPALMLKGNASTLAWNLVRQTVPLEPNAGYRLSFTALAKDVRREGRQYDNCYVGIFLRNSENKRIGHFFQTVASEQWQTRSLTFRTPAGTASGDVTVFLSKTGELHAKEVRLERLQPEQSFQLLVDDMDRHYSFFSLKRIDWKPLTEKYQKRAENAVDVEQFCQVVSEMLGELEDMHIWLDVPGADRMRTHTADYQPNFNYRSFALRLREFRNLRELGFSGRTSAGYGYVNISGLTGSERDVTDMMAAIEGLFDAPGIMVDLRSNGGGSESVGARLAGLFADKRRLYAGSQYRAGPGYDDFTEVSHRYLEPREGKTYTRPIVCLIGPGCMSSGEGMAMMMKSLPHVTLVGVPTQGASGNPAAVMLPNGVDVWYSRWVSLLPDGTPIEGTGIAPDVLIAHEGPNDTTFEMAENILAQIVAKQGK